jgi:cellulose synthase (UDP-forming)
MEENLSETLSNELPIVNRPVNSSILTWRIWILRFVVGGGVIALFFYYYWWFEDGKIFSPLYLIFFIFALVASVPQLLATWYLYLKAREHIAPTSLSNPPTVDVFITAYHEPYALINRALSAAVAMDIEHKTWLLDDGDDPRLLKLAHALGAGYLSRQDSTHAKAGNLNAALGKTDGEIIVIFDADHAPDPDFLVHALPYFIDPEVGFVQVMLTFINHQDGWVARAASESSFDYYNPTSLGADSVGGATHTGSNGLIRRTALDSIHGYQPGLAEDLATSIALSASGWKSVYVRKPLAPGMAPPDLAAWFTQQMKWSRGVFSILLSSYPHYFKHLSWGQRVSYAVRMTYYWVGLAVGIHLLFTILLLSTATIQSMNLLNSYVLHLFPLVVATMLIRQMALARWGWTFSFSNLLWKPIVLIYNTWPIYTLTWIMAILHVPLRFRPTPKTSRGGLNPVWLVPQLLTFLLTVSAALFAYFRLGNLPLFTLFFIGMQLTIEILFVPALLSKKVMGASGQFSN